MFQPGSLLKAGISTMAFLVGKEVNRLTTQSQLIRVLIGQQIWDVQDEVEKTPDLEYGTCLFKRIKQVDFAGLVCLDGERTIEYFEEACRGLVAKTDGQLVGQTIGIEVGGKLSADLSKFAEAARRQGLRPLFFNRST
jgi:hypothetical protein